MWGIIPSAGKGTRIQPLAFSKELLPVGESKEGRQDRPRAISEYLVERMEVAGVSKVCMVISPHKSDIMRYFSDGRNNVRFCYVVQQEPKGLCDALFRGIPFVNENETVVMGLPDTLWFPLDGLQHLPNDILSFLLFPVTTPELYDAVETDSEECIQHIYVKDASVKVNWIWGAIKLPGKTYHYLYRLWCDRKCSDEYFGTLVNAYIGEGGVAKGIRAGNAYVDVGTINGYREAIHLLSNVTKVNSLC